MIIAVFAGTPYAVPFRQQQSFQLQSEQIHPLVVANRPEGKRTVLASTFDQLLPSVAVLRSFSHSIVCVLWPKTVQSSQFLLPKCCSSALVFSVRRKVTLDDCPRSGRYPEKPLHANDRPMHQLEDKAEAANEVHLLLL
jgi:hypothetical protein